MLAATFMITSFPRFGVAAIGDYRGGGGGVSRARPGRSSWRRGGGYYVKLLAGRLRFTLLRYLINAPPPVVFGVPFGLNINIC